MKLLIVKGPANCAYLFGAGGIKLRQALEHSQETGILGSLFPEKTTGGIWLFQSEEELELLQHILPLTQHFPDKSGVMVLEYLEACVTHES